jgi:Phage tail protein (Tail_P2_I)
MTSLQAQPGINDLRAQAHLALSARLKSLDLTPLFIYGPNAPAGIQPFLAWQLDVLGPYWQLLAGTSNQAALISNAIALHKLAGTPAAIETLIANSGLQLLSLQEGQSSWGGTSYPADQGWAVFRVTVLLANPNYLLSYADFDSVPDVDQLSDWDKLDVSEFSPVPVSGALEQLLVGAINFLKPQRSVLDQLRFQEIAISDAAPMPTDRITILSGEVIVDRAPMPTDVVTAPFWTIADVKVTTPTYNAHFRHAGINHTGTGPAVVDSGLTLNGEPIEGSP